jgi:hypothetical protein
MNIGLLSINRYFHICHNNLYNKIFSYRLTFFYMAMSWCIGILIEIPNNVGWGGLYYDDKTLNCIWNRLASQSYSIFFPMSSIVVPCVCILFCYFRIFLYSHNAKTRVSSNAVAGRDVKSKSRDMARSLRIAKGLFASFLLFTICWLPYGLVVMTDFGDHFPAAVHAYTMALAHLNSSLNPLLYALS